MTHRYILIVISLIILAASGMAETPVEPSGASVSDFLTPNGQFDLEAARQSGFEGSLTLTGLMSTLILKRASLCYPRPG